MAGLVLLGICGSTRRGSLHRALLRAIGERLPPGASLAIRGDLEGLPIFCDDLPDPPAVLALKAAIAEADGLVLAVPEYNYSIPGGLKNALDWLSRPPETSPLAGVPAAIVGASPGPGGARRARAHMRDILECTETPCLEAPEVCLDRAHRRLGGGEGGGAPDPETGELLSRFGAALVAFVRAAGRRAPLAVGLLGLVLSARTARAAGAACPAEAGEKRLGAARGAPVVDGRLDDDVWRRACFADDFAQRAPVYGAPPTRPIRVAVALGGDRLYVAARMWSAGPADLDAALTERDATDQAEHFAVSLDPARTRRTAYSFAVTARGVRADWAHADDAEAARDLSWNPVWIARTELLPDGWSAELAIPLSQLRLPREARASWGINFQWYLPRRSEDVRWRAAPPDRTAWASDFGELIELPPVRPGVSLEVAPYVALRGAVHEAAPGAPEPRARGGLEVGLDAKLRPLPGLAIDATVNPDFGQVEADPAYVNLTAYEVQLAEKRPFFVENNALFEQDGAPYFYSRRIGALPARLPAHDAIAPPAQVRILGAAAIGGYVARRTRLAALAAVTGEARADAIVDGAPAELVVAPLALWAAARVERGVGAASAVGATATLVERALGGTGLAPLLPSRAVVAAANAQWRTADGEWELAPRAAASSVAGAPEAIEALQRSSARYFQRPDQRYLRLDPDARRLAGWSADAYLTKRSGLYRGYVGGAAKSPGWEPNDLGALAQTDGLELAAALERVDATPRRHLHAWSVGGSADQEWTFGGERKPPAVRGHVRATLPSLWTAGLAASAGPPGVQPGLTRGGPSVRVGWSGAATASAASPAGRATQVAAQLDVYASRTLLRGLAVQAMAAVRPTPAVRLDASPRLVLVGTERQYLAAVEDPRAEGTYGARYVFGHLRRREVSLELRATVALTPDLALTIYAQPFVSVGRYDRLGELSRAGGGDVRWYESAAADAAAGVRRVSDGEGALAIPEPDFAVASLRSTAVLRWELRPGSTLHLAWRQDRGGEARAMARPLSGAAGDAFAGSAVHTVALRLSYWID